PADDRGDAHGGRGNGWLGPAAAALTAEIWDPTVTPGCTTCTPESERTDATVRIHRAECRERPDPEGSGGSQVEGGGQRLPSEESADSGERAGSAHEDH